MTEQELIRKILAGDRDLYREVVSRYYPKVIRVAKKVVQEEKDAEDIAQMVFLQAYRSLSTFRFESSFSTWIYQISISKSLDWYRKQQRQTSEKSVHDNNSFLFISSPSDKPDELLLRREEGERLHSHLRCLPAIYQQVIHLYYFQECSYKEIAEKLNISSKTVESRLYRGKALLRKLVGEERLS